MLKRIDFNNYKAFKTGELEIKPITLLLGANSSGKSSIIQLILMIVQTINYDKPYQSALRLNGDLVRLGEIENIFPSKNTELPIEFEFQLNGFSNRMPFRRLKDSIEDIYFSLDKINSLLSSEKTNTNSLRHNLYKSEIERQEESIEFRDILDDLLRVKRQINRRTVNKNVDEIEAVITRYFRHFRNRRLRDTIYSKETNKIVADFIPYKYAFKLLESFDNANTDIIYLKYRIYYNLKLNKLDVDKISVRTEEFDILTYSYERVRRGKHHVLSSDFIDTNILDKYRSKFGNQISFEGLSMVRKSHDEINETNPSDIFLKTIFGLFEDAISVMNSAFDNDRINYVSPLRAFPKRYYFLDEAVENNSLNSIDGNQLAEILHENNDIRRKVNIWLEKFKLRVSVSKMKDVIHNIRITQSGLNLDITDVGFGISQLLPIIVQGFLSDDNSLTIIEQPEIHLHPKMQAELADLFIDIINNNKEDHKGKSLLIETHSEYLLKRLRRRIAEGVISNDDVAIYFVNSRDKENKFARLEKIEISKTGAFEWPSDFYIDDLNDTIEFLKHQN